MVVKSFKAAQPCLLPTHSTHQQCSACLVLLAVQAGQRPAEVIATAATAAVQQVAQLPQHAFASCACLQAAFFKEPHGSAQQAGDQGAAASN